VQRRGNPMSQRRAWGTGVQESFRGHRVVLRFTPEADMVLLVDTFGTDFEPFMNVFVVADDELNLLECRVIESRLGVEVEARSQYYIQIGGVVRGLEFGTLALELTAGVPPPNDDFVDAINVETLPFSTNTDTIAAVLEPQEAVPACASSNFELGSSGLVSRFVRRALAHRG